MKSVPFILEQRLFFSIMVFAVICGKGHDCSQVIAMATGVLLKEKTCGIIFSSGSYLTLDLSLAPQVL